MTEADKYVCSSYLYNVTFRLKVMFTLFNVVSQNNMIIEYIYLNILLGLIILIIWYNNLLLCFHFIRYQGTPVIIVCSLVWYNLEKKTFPLTFSVYDWGQILFTSRFLQLLHIPWLYLLFYYFNIFWRCLLIHCSDVIKRCLICTDIFLIELIFYLI